MVSRNEGVSPSIFVFFSNLHPRKELQAKEGFVAKHKHKAAKVDIMT